MVRLSLKPLLCFLAAATLALAGCAPATRAPTPSTPSTSSQSVQPQAVQPNQSITLALLTPQSSPNQGAASLGRALVNSARMAMVDLNNRQVSLKVYDTGGDQARAAQQARTAIAEGADIILGPLFSASTRSVARVAGPQGIKVLSFSTDSSVAGNGVWLTGFLPEMEAKRILAFARSQGRGQVGVFHP
ncbi:MAG: ABC transporter substrate-binding protein, partial [Pseudomonadota bacterium]